MLDGITKTNYFERARIDFGNFLERKNEQIQRNYSKHSNKVIGKNMLKNIGKTRWFANSLERFESVLYYLYVDYGVNSAERFGTVLHYLPVMFLDSVERF